MSRDADVFDVAAIADRTFLPVTEPALRWALLGFAAPIGCIDALPDEARREVAALWRLGAPGVAALFREHPRHFFDAARRLGLKPTILAQGRRMFFCEYVARERKPWE
jgi:hypothetical protein